MGSLLGEIESSKLTDESVKKSSNTAPSVKDIQLKDCKN